MEVSVICPVFNTHPALLAMAMRSVLDQAGPHSCELIFVDDASTNADTHAALRAAAAADSRVRAVFQEKNAGPGQARTVGVQHSDREWIGFIDSDDVWLEERLNAAAVVLQERPDARWIAGRYTMMFAGGRLQVARLLNPPDGAADGRLSHRLSAPGLTRSLVGDWQPLGAGLVRRDLFLASGGFDARLVYGEDWLLCLRLSTLAPMDYTEVPAYMVRRQGMSMMRSPARLSTVLVDSVRLAQRDPALRAVRRELRWFLYTNYKDLAMNNALNGRKVRGAWFALQAFGTDPREVGDLSRFLRDLRRSGPELAAALRGYSTAEQFVVADVPPQYEETKA